jgi:Holliday junction resolvase
MGKAQRDKGYRVERELVLSHRAFGVPAERVPLSGGQGGSFTGDIRILSDEYGFLAEVKARKDGAGFKQLEQWLGTNDVLFLKRNNAQPLVVVGWDAWLRLIMAYTKAVEAGLLTRLQQA